MLPLDLNHDDVDPTDEPVDLSGLAEDSGPDEPTSPWENLEAYVALPRLGELTLSPDGSRLVAAVSRLSPDQTAYVSSLWEIDPAGGPAHRLTRCVEGDAIAAITRDNDLLFTSKRPALKDSEDVKDSTKTVWCLPSIGGEAYPLARRDGGWKWVLAARESDTIVFAIPVHEGVETEEADAGKRAERTKKKVSALLHDGYPVRFWDHDLGLEWPRLLRATIRPGAELGADDCLPVGGDLGRCLVGKQELSADGRWLLSGWREPAPRGQSISSLAIIDVKTGERRILAQGNQDVSYLDAIFDRDGARVAAIRHTTPTPDLPSMFSLVVIDVVTGAETVVADEWDRIASPIAFTPEGTQLLVSADEDGDAPLFLIDLASDEVRRLTGPGAFSSAQLSPDGATIYAIRTAYDCPGEVVALDVMSGEQQVLDAGLTYPQLPGTVERVETHAADGVCVRGYLIKPTAMSVRQPGKLVLWVHGGPVSSWNSWSWRWCPWLLVSLGYTILLPDPALSTGYGYDFIKRGWGRWGEEPFTDIMALFEATCERADVDAAKPVMMGGSFGGYMANWIATQTGDRFAGIVSHASLWNLTSFGPTTDSAAFWSHEMTPEMMVKNSPHQYADKITTPMLVIHGDKDYRVPISEGLALWWALVSCFEGNPADLPHKFLYFPDENHWVLAPQHAIIWYETVRAFVAHVVEGQEFQRPALL